MSKLDVTHIASITFVKDVETGEWDMRNRPEYVSTYEELTKEDLEGAAHDLANASRVARYAGHAYGCTLDRITGSVCMVGAIEIATYKEIYTNDVGEYFDFTTEEWVEAGVQRADSAILALAEVIPGGLCSGCPVDRHHIGTFPYNKITHFSDFHCTGAQQSARLLDVASIVAHEAAECRTLRAVATIPAPRAESEVHEVGVA
jgi:hypothetical protein